MLDLTNIAKKLDADEKLRLTYRTAVRADNGQVEYTTQTDKILDVAEEANLIYVSRNGEVVWVKLEEAIEVEPDIA